MNIKSLLLGSAAALVAVTGARAADAVVVAEPEPVEYVRVCDVYGAGFYYIPGTETCMKVGGYIRYDIGVGALGHQDVDDRNSEDDDNDLNDTFYKKARFAIRFDARTETELGTLRREIVGRAGAVEAEMKVEADGDAGDGKSIDQYARHEILGGKARERGVEPQHDRAGEAGRGQQAQLRAFVREAEQRLVRTEEGAGMRFEGQRRGRPGERLGARQRGRDHRPVAAMHAVEIADGDDRAVERVVRGCVATDHGERLGRLRLVGHGGGGRHGASDDDGCARSLITVRPVIARPSAGFKQASP